MSRPSQLRFVLTINPYPALACTRATALTGAAAVSLPGGLILKINGSAAGLMIPRGLRSRDEVGMRRFGTM
jgi:hypothetical protein